MMLTKQHFTSTELPSHDEDPTPEAGSEVLSIGVVVGSASDGVEGTVEVPGHIANNFDQALATHHMDDYTGPEFTAAVTFDQSESILEAFTALYESGHLFRMWAMPLLIMGYGRAEFRRCIVTDIESVTDDRTDEDVVKVDVSVKHAW